MLQRYCSQLHLLPSVYHALRYCAAILDYMYTTLPASGKLANHWTHSTENGLAGDLPHLDSSNLG